MKTSFLVESLNGKEDQGRRWRVRVMRSGLSANGNFYSDRVLREATPLFNGARVFVKGDAEHLAGTGKDFRNLIGRLSSPSFVEGASADSGEIVANFDVLESAGGISARLLEAWQRGMADMFGFSIDAIGSARAGKIAGRAARIAESLKSVQSVDLIVEPAAGGSLVKLLESTEMKILTREQIEATIRESKLPAKALDRLIKMHNQASDLTDEALREAIAAERDYVASFTETGRVTGLGDDPGEDYYGRNRVVEGRHEKSAKMLDAFFDPNDRSVRSIRQCYVELTGDKHFTGLYRNCDKALLREALNSQSFPDVLGDSITRRLITDYRTENHYDVWRKLVNIVPVNDFRVQERTRYGGYSDLPVVNEGAPYLELDSPTDEKSTYAVKKRGGTESLTMEMIANDDVGAVQAIPRKLTRAAKRTISKFVLDFIKNNPAIYDSVALFHADHGNLGTTALASASLAAGRLAIFKQTEMNSGDRLGTNPSYLWVGPDLEEAAVDLFRRNTNNDKTFVQSLTMNVMPVWYWTDANDWALSTDPNEVPTIELGFFNGNEEPELFIQDVPTQGSMFSHDQVTYKVRHIYGGNVVDYRGLYKAVVA